jgi:hypothetical protein
MTLAKIQAQFQANLLAKAPTPEFLRGALGDDD